mmetsp:Transcript_51018/g.165146  ORF Transcript_51018/g.165146 Transcript_51018/m.165146 type:complete len:261 (+) Transcript_51018:10-792(+)
MHMLFQLEIHTLVGQVQERLQVEGHVLFAVEVVVQEVAMGVVTCEARAVLRLRQPRQRGALGAGAGRAELEAAEGGHGPRRRPVAAPCLPLEAPLLTEGVHAILQPVPLRGPNEVQHCRRLARWREGRGPALGVEVAGPAEGPGGLGRPIAPVAALQRADGPEEPRLGVNPQLRRPQPDACHGQRRHANVVQSQPCKLHRILEHFLNSVGAAEVPAGIQKRQRPSVLSYSPSRTCRSPQETLLGILQGVPHARMVPTETA